MSARIRANTRRLLPLADQIVASVTNVAVAVLVAQNASAAEFGVYAIVSGAYWLALGAGRALVGEPLLILGHDAGPVRPMLQRAASSLGFFVGVAFGCLIAIVGMLTGLRPLLVLAAFLPLLIWQDSLRYVFFDRRQQEWALLSDGLWLAVLLAVAAALGFGHSRHVGVGEWVAVWGIGAAGGGIAAAFAGRVRPTRRIRAAVARGRASASHLVGDFLLGNSGQQIVIYALPLVASLSALGALKAAQVALGPLNILVSAVSVSAIPRLAALYSERDLAAIRKLGLRLVSGLSGLGLLYTIGLMVLPASLGQGAFGDSWPAASDVLPFIGLQSAITAGTVGIGLVLRGTQNTFAGFRARVIFTPVGIAFPLAGAALGGLDGMAVGLLASAVVGISIWTLVARQVLRRLGAGNADAGPVLGQN